MDYSDIFINRVGHLRSGWRLLTFISSFIFLNALLGSILPLTLALFNTEYFSNNALLIAVNSSISFVVAVLLGWLCGKYLEELPFRALGIFFTGNWLKDLIFGLILGALTLGLAVLVAVAFGGLSFDFNQSQNLPAVLLSLSTSLAIFIVGAAFEEAFFRGYILQTFARADLAWLAISLTSIFFAVAHLGNDNATYISTANTALAGIWFSIAYLKTRTLWLPFGLHLMWNWFQGAIFGIEVSGITFLTTAPLLKETDAGPIWLTGENYGIEGGIAATVAIIVSSLLIWLLPIFRSTDEMLALTGPANPKNEDSNG